MFDDFESRRITLITAPVNMRLGYDRLATKVQAYLGIDLSKAEDYVVFSCLVLRVQPVTL